MDNLTSQLAVVAEGDLLLREARAVLQRVRLGQEGTKPLEVVREKLGLGS